MFMAQPKFVMAEAINLRMHHPESQLLKHISPDRFIRSTQPVVGGIRSEIAINKIKHRLMK